MPLRGRMSDGDLVIEEAGKEQPDMIDTAALTATLNVIIDSSRAEQERVQAINSVRQQKVPAVRDALVKRPGRR